eukprot:gene23783-9343_t
MNKRPSFPLRNLGGLLLNLQFAFTIGESGRAILILSGLAACDKVEPKLSALLQN